MVIFVTLRYYLIVFFALVSRQCLEFTSLNLLSHYITMSIVKPMNRRVPGLARWRAQGPDALSQSEARIVGHQARPAYHWLELPKEAPPPQVLVETSGEKIRRPMVRGP